MSNRLILLFAALLSISIDVMAQNESKVIVGGSNCCYHSVSVADNEKNKILHVESIGAFQALIDINGEQFNFSDINADTIICNPDLKTAYYYYNIESKQVLISTAMRMNDIGLYEWSLSVNNPFNSDIIISRLCVPIDFNNDYVLHSINKLFEEQVIYQNWISGNSSYIMSMLPTGLGNYLLITPSNGTSIDYYERDGRYFLAYDKKDIHKSWNRDVSSVIVPAKNSHTFSLSMRSVSSYQEAQDVFVENGDIAVEIAPSLTIAMGTELSVAIRTNVDYHVAKGDKYKSKFIRSSGEWDIYNFTFSDYGEHQIVIDYGKNKRTYIDAFVTEPVEALIKKRVGHIVDYQQVIDSTVWYNTMYGQWEMHKTRLLTPENNEDYYQYIASGSDDPSLSKSTLIATKNVIYPNVNEIRSLERYIKTFLWGGMQRTDLENPFPYAIYGCDSWYYNRKSTKGYNVGGVESERMWRSFDYSHIFKLYYCMYKMAKLYPELMEYADAEEYLQRAYGTAMAFYRVPYSINMSPRYWTFSGWCDWSYKLGVFHERVLVDIIDALQNEGKSAEADTLRHEWEKKVKYFVYDTPYPFGSEMSIDATAFESTHAVAKYGISHPLQPDSALWVDKNSGRVYSHPSVKKDDFVDFMYRQLQANLASRGVLQSSYYNYGSDMRGSGSMHYQLSYMAQLGGAPLLDYGLNYADDSDHYIRWGYASLLSAWCLVNTGYWFDGDENIGGAGWAFEPCINAPLWCTGNYTVSHTIWPLDGEIDCGFIGAIDAAMSVVYDSPIFGKIALGAEFKQYKSRYTILPYDGVAQRVRLRDDGAQMDIDIDRDAIYRMTVDNEKHYFKIEFENITADKHNLILNIAGLENGTWIFKCNNECQTYNVDNNTLQILIPIDKSMKSVELKFL